MDTIEGNKLIARFMQSDSLPHRYDSSWDWLMPVLAAITASPAVLLITKNRCADEGSYMITYRDDRQVIRNQHIVEDYGPDRPNRLEIDAAFKIVVRFLTWYNSANNSQTND